MNSTTLFLTNLIILTGVLYLFAIQVSKYNGILLDKYRFSYFALRDRLALLVMQGKLDEESWEYEKIVNAINFHIQATERVSIHKIIAILVAYHTSPEEERKVKAMLKRTDNQDVVKIMIDYFDTTASLLKRNSRMQMWFIKTLIAHGRAARSKKLHPIVDHQEAYNKVSSYKESFQQHALV